MDEQQQNMNPNPENNEGQNQPPQEGGMPGADPKDVEDNKVMGVLAYIGILCLIPLLVKKDSKFAHFHAKQGLILFIIEVIGSFLIPVFGIGALIHLAAFVFSIMGIVNVLGGQMKKLPLIGDWAEKINL